MATNHRSVRRPAQKSAPVEPAQDAAPETISQAADETEYSAPAIETLAQDVSAAIEPPVETFAESVEAAPAPAETFVETVPAAPDPVEIVAEAPAPVPVIVTVSASGKPAFDPLALPLKTLDLWNDNLAACMLFAKDLSGVTSVGEAFELQSRFAQECSEAFLRQSKELAEIAARTARLPKFDGAKFGVALVC